MNDSIVVTIDGPAGAGKSTVARAVAQQLSLLYLDTGAIYRTVALAAMQAGIDLEDAQAVTKLAADIVERDGLRMAQGREGMRILLDGQDVSTDIRTPEVSRGASLVSVHPGVRRALLDMQRAIAKRGGVVVEGRDTGTVVFPNAQAKFFLTASVEERARRRFEQLRETGQSPSMQELIQQVKERDERDTTRATAPLRRAEDATEVDCSNMSAEQVVSFIVERVRDKMVSAASR